MTTTYTGQHVITTVAGEYYTVWQLARMAGCADPDSPTSSGAKFLISVADATSDQISVYRTEQTPEDRIDDRGELHEIADGMVPVYTHAIWSTFVDLAAYEQDIEDLASGETDMEKLAMIALYVIAECLVHSLVKNAGPFDGDEA